ncbi:RNA polymerase, sigma-24 subunit, ECF subfamily [Ruminiclostridium papyrosolvens DSM 2782]|uniref:RNA polymerase, sigma-24 subunit, ECF subfamily n=1 Tax=Ruminiclostridium papyrosolvens DSM 2782 TaxID=588581 RepID=F1TE51_9FIRM|nr:RNA polymerase sigma factor [Ruminiclostridium papyrosolvens]EGD47291.1 RNA polymerase, sigma-24 subunit, ECF subfamily [Ruminiclostridium papyrosolvens DSM 2782]WES34637.1 RNA polymerase sigma factor [Ruminiclostridium papyrosolvens DSM 2782]
MDRINFAEEVRKSETTLYHVSKSILQNDKDCEDAVQEAILRAYNKLSSLKKEQFFKTWLVRILIHECYKIRRYRKKVISYEEYINPEDTTEPKDYSELYLSIMKLDEDLRTIVILYYIEGFSVAETADILKMREGTVKSRLSRARTNLKKYLQEV